MEFNDSFEIEDVQIEDVWNALSDPVIVRNSLPGCKCLVKVADEDDVDFDQILEEHSDSDEDESYAEDARKEREFKEGETYAAVVTISVGPVNPRFDTLVTIEERDFPSMEANGEGSTGDSSFEMESSMTLKETDDGVSIDWEASVDIVGRLAQMGQRMINPAANRVVKKFFTDIESELAEATADQENSDSTGGVQGNSDSTEGEQENSDSTEGEQENSDSTEIQRQQGGGLLARLKQLLGIGNNA